MAGLTSIPTRTDGSLGRVKEDLRPADDFRFQLRAEEYNRLADAVIALCQAIGLGDATTPESLTRTVSLKADLSALADKASLADLALKADVSALALKADLAALATKVDQATFENVLAGKADLAALATKADLSALADLVDSSTFASALALKADLAALATKVDSSTFTSALAGKVNLADFGAHLVGLGVHGIDAVAGLSSALADLANRPAPAAALFTLTAGAEGFKVFPGSGPDEFHPDFPDGRFRVLCDLSQAVEIRLSVTLLEAGETVDGVLYLEASADAGGSWAGLNNKTDPKDIDPAIRCEVGGPDARDDLGALLSSPWAPIDGAFQTEEVVLRVMLRDFTTNSEAPVILTSIRAEVR